MPPSLPSASQGSFVPSPHSKFLFAFLPNTATPYALLHSLATVVSDDPSKCQIQYLKHWRIDQIVIASLEAEGLVTDDRYQNQYLHEKARRLDILSKIQSQIVQEYAILKQNVQDWFVSDEQRRKSQIEDGRQRVQVDSDTIDRVGSLVMKNRWRQELGWEGDSSLRSTVRCAHFKFQTSLVNQATDERNGPHGTGSRGQHFVWNCETGSWVNSVNNKITKARLYSQRLDYLHSELQRLTCLRNRALQEHGLDSLTALNDRGRFEYSKAKRSRCTHLRKQPPQKRFTVGLFVPDNETTVFDDGTGVKQDSESHPRGSCNQSLTMWDDLKDRSTCLKRWEEARGKSSHNYHENEAGRVQLEFKTKLKTEELSKLQAYLEESDSELTSLSRSTPTESLSTKSPSESLYDESDYQSRSD